MPLRSNGLRENISNSYTLSYENLENLTQAAHRMKLSNLKSEQLLKHPEYISKYSENDFTYFVLYTAYIIPRDKIKLCYIFNLHKFYSNDCG